MIASLKFPANAMMVIEFMIQLATFDLIPTSFIDEQVFYWPESDPFSVSFEMAGTETVFLLANIGFAIYMIYYHVFIAVVHACLHPLRKSSRILSKLHTKISNYLYWDGFHRFYMELFSDLTFLSILNLYTADWNTPFLSVKISNYLSIVTLIVIAGVLLVYIVSFVRLPQENRIEKFGAKFEPLFDGMDYQKKRKNGFLIGVPLFYFSKRLIFVSILVLASEYLWV